MKKNDVVYVDADGVLIDFHGGILKTINDYTGKDFQYSDINGWNIYAALGLSKGAVGFVETAIRHPAWVYSLPVLEGAREMFDKLRGEHPIKIATTPYPGHKHWHYERVQSLKDNFLLSEEDIIFIKDKSLLRGYTLIDDALHNVKAWEEANPSKRLPRLVNRPWNQEKTTIMQYERVTDWGNL